jgi:radical SAM protein with 4Fe4S-binding SPASM domain
MKRYFFGDNCKVTVNQDKVVIGNSYNGHWIKISKECYDILLEGQNEKLSIKAVLENFEDAEDREYLKCLFTSLRNLGVLYCEGEKQEQPKRGVLISVTHRCNLKCRHCFVSASPELDDQLLYDNLIEIIDKVCEFGVQQIVFTGGEPLVRSDFLAILKYTRNKFDGTIGLMTNGTLINEKNASVLVSNLDTIDISLDGIDEQTCSKIRGKGVFEKVISAIKLLQREGFEKISLSMVMTKENEAYEKEFDLLNEQLGTMPMKRKFSPVGRGSDNREEFELHVEENKNPIMDIETAQQEVAICHCGVISKTLYINYDGGIYPCNTLEKPQYVLGNINDYKTLDFLKDTCCLKSIEGYRRMENIFPENFAKCKECSVNLFCWECLHFIDMANEGIIEIGDCSKRKRELEAIVWSD